MKILLQNLNTDGLKTPLPIFLPDYVVEEW